jgi:hypothetical protein
MVFPSICKPLLHNREAAVWSPTNGKMPLLSSWHKNPEGILKKMEKVFVCHSMSVIYSSFLGVSSFPLSSQIRVE